MEIPNRNSAAGKWLGPDCSRVAVEHRVDIGDLDPAGREFLPIPGLREERLGSEDACRSDNGLLEWLVFESMQRVVMDEDVDRPLGR